MSLKTKANQQKKTTNLLIPILELSTKRGYQRRKLCSKTMCTKIVTATVAVVAAAAMAVTAAVIQILDVSSKRGHK